jgi:putative ABC transport system permease protein
MNFTENIRIAMDSVRANWLRATLTLIIIAFGIMALVGILTAIDSAIYSLNDNLSFLGANTFDVDPIGDGARGRDTKRGEPFTYSQSIKFKERYQFPARAALSIWGTGTATVVYANRETNPNIPIFGVDENYIEAKGFTMNQGRNFTAREALQGGNIAILGNDLVEDLFQGRAESAIDKIITAGGNKYRVVGVLKSKGSSMNQSEDRRVLVPLQTAKRYYDTPETNYNIMVAVNDPSRIEAAIGEATVLLRNVRGLRADQQNDFEITKSDSLIGIIKENTLYLRLAAVGIALITLLGAAIGLMNIMLVSVTERTREIGVRKALGATRQNVLTQFLVEAVVICQMGGLLGIALGVLVGNVVTLLLGGSFLFPWLWITIALITCTFVGLLSGLYPAMRAAELDPIESLRYE